MPRLYPSLIVILTFAALGWGGVSFLEGSRPTAERLPAREVGMVPVVVRVLETSPEKVHVAGFGTISANREASLASELGGRVTRRLEPWSVGRFVAAGTLLVGVDSSILDQELSASRAAVTVAEADLELAEVEIIAAAGRVPFAAESLKLAEREEKRLAQLSGDSYMSESQLDSASRVRLAAARTVHDAQAAVRRAQASKVRAQATLVSSGAQLGLQQERRKLAELHAEFDGYLVEPGPAVGSYLIAGERLGSLVDTSELRVILEIPEEDFVGIELGQRAHVRLPAQEAWSFEARVIGLGVEAHPKLRSMSVEVSLEEGINLPAAGALSSSLLRPGQFVEVQIEVGEVALGLLLSRDEIVWLDGDPSAFVVVDSEQGLLVERRALTLGARVASGFLIEAGLKSDERLITAPLGRLAGGELCRVRGN
ncbi:MAG: hypothetical protein ACI8X5_000172 [Planctomycetota bacterium]|jgi:hypothetical protein